MRNKYGDTVRGKLLRTAERISIIGYEPGLARQLKSGSVDWGLNSAGSERGTIGATLEISGIFPKDFSIVRATLQMDDGCTSMELSRSMHYSMNRDPFAQDFLQVLTDTLEVYENELCLNGLTHVAAATEAADRLAALRSATTGEILVA